MKTCSKCSQEKLEAHFDKNGTYLHGVCKKCRLQQEHARYHKPNKTENKYKYGLLKSGSNVEYAIQGPDGLYGTGTAYNTTCDDYEPKLIKLVTRLNMERGGKFTSIYNRTKS